MSRGSLSPQTWVPWGRHRAMLSFAPLPLRFRSVHCLLYPDTPWCPTNMVY